MPSESYKEINIGSNVRSLHTLSIFNNSVQILKKFNEEKINYRLLKGSYLNTKEHYFHSKRPVKDIDIIIEKNDLFRALSLCLDNGYVFKEKSLNNSELEFTFDYKYDLPNLVNESNQILELHFRFSDPFDYEECIFVESVFQNNIERDLFGVKAKFPSPINQILMSIYSGTQKRYFDSGSLFLYDFYQIQKEFEISDNEVLKASKKIGIQSFAELALGVKNSFLNDEKNPEKRFEYAKGLIVYNRVSDSKRLTNLYFNKNIFQIIEGIIMHSFSSSSISASLPYKSNFLKLISLPKRIYEQLVRVAQLIFMLSFSSQTKKELKMIKELLGNINEK